MSKSKTIIFSLIVMALWGVLFPLVKMGYEAFGIVSTSDIIYFAGFRFTICGAAICIYGLITEKENFKQVKHSVGPVLWSGVFAIILHYSLSYSGLMFTDSSKTAILKQIGSIFYVCFSWMFFKEDKLTWQKIAGVILGFGGIIVINTSAAGVSFGIGEILIIASSFCYIISNIISKKALTKVSPIAITGCSQLFGGVVLLIIGKAAGGTMTISFDRSLIIMLCICIASIFSYCLWFITVKNGELSKMFIIKFAEPVFASIFGALLLGENIFKIQYLLSFVLIASGIYISNMKKGTS